MTLHDITAAKFRFLSA